MAIRLRLAPPGHNDEIAEEPSTARILSVDTAILVGAALRLGRREMSSAAYRRLTEQLKERDLSGDLTARLALDWLQANHAHDAHHAHHAHRTELRNEHRRR